MITLETSENLQTIFEILPVGIRILSLDDWSLLYSNRACLKMFGCTSFSEQVKGTSGFQFMPEIQPDGRKTVDTIKEFMNSGDTVLEFQCLKLDGKPFICRMSTCTVVYEGHRASLAVMEDITEKEIYRQKLESMALYDQLTQIPNRHCFFINANPLFDKCQREKRELSLLYTDIDYFKQINDTFGHDFGDAVMKRYAAVIRESVRKYDLYCRYGGEEFLIMMECGESVVKNLAARIMERLKSESFDEVPDFKFTISAGINAGVPREGETLGSFINDADSALYEAKNRGRNTICFHK